MEGERCCGHFAAAAACMALAPNTGIVLAVCNYSSIFRGPFFLLSYTRFGGIFHIWPFKVTMLFAKGGLFFRKY